MMRFFDLLMQIQYSANGFDPANVYLAASTVLLSICVYFLKRHVDGQDKVIARLDMVIERIKGVEVRQESTGAQIDHLTEKIENIEHAVNQHETEITVLRGKIPA